jgi:DNA-binding CsgD family transcriptional regulator
MVNNAILVARRDTPAGVARRETPTTLAHRLPAADPPSSLPLASRRGPQSGPSPRERDVLRLLADGHSTREIAIRLAYSERTIKNILQDLTTRLSLRNRTQAVAHAVRSGWI